MTNTHDLSLLTDEERKKYRALPYAVEEVAINDIREVFHALIASRAENKRKDEMLAKAEESLIWASGAFQSDEESAAWVKHGRPVLDDLRALLQSEKGGE